MIKVLGSKHQDIIHERYLSFTLALFPTIVLITMSCSSDNLVSIGIFFKVDGAMHFIYSHKYNTNSAEDLSDMN